MINIKQIIIVRTKRRCFENIGYEWLKIKENQIKQSSYYNYKFIIERYLTPYFGEKNIKKCMILVCS